ncbi:hypothetical protein N7539_005664 [Penicillium diatomitis]|uniref:Glycosyl transferase CAP10 domain-containing protein n=1 Tax=Penicillium diatomitis TaxID=2819901 RepID=A0A9W9X7U9_9EURO|nr:uncharacterized protein N7539_005664 [Penicillium diatomitis]KAJ5485676.1 hypothetical protein N7539_005664 [Penicillium diatomitis]
MLAPKPSLRFIALGLMLSLGTLAILLLHIRSTQDRKSQYILKTSSSGLNSQSHCEQTSQTPSSTENDTWEFNTKRDALNYGLSDEQCQLAFPKLFVDIEKSAALKKAISPITFDDLDSREVEDGMVRAMIVQGQLYIIEYASMPVTATRARATLHSLHRALMADPNRHILPNIEFILTSEDFATEPTGRGPIWAYSKREADDAVWLMPDFGYWAWPEVRIGPYHEIQRRIAAIDDGEIHPDGTVTPGLKFAEKKKQLVWRGSLATNPAVRGRLLKSTQGKSWASVRVIDWDDENDIRFNLLPIEDHCRYMFLAHTEGRSFSGRGKYLLNCRSVVVSHPLIWREAHHAALVATGPDANFVEVSEDFSDLSRKLDYLIDNPQVAERIAENAVRTFRDRYLTPAAESCYWRRLIRQYGSVLDFEPNLHAAGRDGKLTARGTPFETWSLMH